MSKWVIFNFYDGDFIRQNNEVVRFKTKGLACQFLRHYQRVKPIQVRREVTVNYSYYKAPFKLVRVSDYETI